MAVDLFRIATVAELAEALVSATLSNRSALRRVLHQTHRAGRFVADTIQSTAVLKSKTQLGEELEIAFAPGIVSGPAASISRRVDRLIALLGAH